MKTLSVTVLLALAVSPLLGQAAEGPEHWYRCNTHTHTTARPNSDANGEPEFVAEWYRTHGYQCVVITDHEYLTDVAPLNARYKQDNSFLVLKGQEVTQAIMDPPHFPGLRYFHVNGINLSAEQPIMPFGSPGVPKGDTPASVYEHNVAAIEAAGGIPQINHPNLSWSVMPDDLMGIKGPFLMEVWNSFPTSNNLGGTDDEGNTSLSTDALWDILLSRGKTVWGVASDDVHDYKHTDDRETPSQGKGWIVLKAGSLTVPSITDAMRTGHFYASTGIKLASYSFDSKGISMQIEVPLGWSSKAKTSTRYVTRFIGKNGKVLAEVTGTQPHYAFKGDEMYVRAFIIDSDGRKGWTQPVFRDSRATAK